jgi:hypothetical protein
MGKRCYPAEFMAAVLTNGKGFYQPLVYVLESCRLGLKFLPPSVNESEPAFIPHGDASRVEIQQAFEDYQLGRMRDCLRAVVLLSALKSLSSRNYSALFLPMLGSLVGGGCVANLISLIPRANLHQAMFRQILGNLSP